MLASAARLILGQLGHDAPVSVGETINDADVVDLVTAELGSDWPRLVAPVFDGRKAVLFDDRWASAREDLARLWLVDEGEIDGDWKRISERFDGAGHVVATQANWWQGRALAAGRTVHASLYGRAAAGAENPGKGRYTDEVAVVTGASKGSIAASVVAQLLDGGATVIATTSKLDDDRLGFYKGLYRDNARFDATLWVVPANMASYADIDALVSWVGNEQTESPGPQSIHLKDAQTPTLLFPFAAPRVAGDLSDAGSRAEMEMKVLLWAVQRLIGGLSHIGAERDIAARLHVVLPGSPNRGMFGGDGAYGEVEVRPRRRGHAVEGRDLVVAASFAGARADRLDQGHRADGPQRRHRRRRRRGGGDHLLHRGDGLDAVGAVRHRVQGRRGAGAVAGRSHRRAGRGRHRHGRAGRQGTRRDGDRERRGGDRRRGHGPCTTVAAARLQGRACRRRGTTSTSTRPIWS